MKKVFFCLLCITLCVACEKDETQPDESFQGRHLGLSDHIINKVQVVQTNLFAATDKGFYALSLIGGNKNWDLLGFENKQCQSFLIINESEMIVSLVNRQDMTQTGLFKTNDGGESWIEYTNGFGGKESIEPIWDITVDPENSSTYYAVGEYVVAKSTNKGLNWEPIFGEWQGFTTGMDFVRINPADPGSIWVGGQNAIEQGFVLYSPDGGENWQEWFDLIEAPSVAKEIAFHPTEASEVYIGFEGGLLKTPNNGQTWNTLIDSEDNRFFFGLSIRQSNPEVMYAGGWLKRFDEPQPLIIYSSNDGGNNWQEHMVEGVDFGGIYDMELVSEGGQDKLLLGLYKGGVYEVTFNQ